MKIQKQAMRAIKPRFLWLALLAAVLILFPFDWLSQVWPAFGVLFDQIFVSAREHAIGHTTIFLIAGVLVLCALPQLRRSPLLYICIMVVGMVGEEFFQALSRQLIPNFGDVRDLGFDALGSVLAYLLAWVWWHIREKKL